MPRKPTSVFVIAENPTLEQTPPGMPSTHLMAWRIPLGDEDTVEDVVKRCYEAQPIGTRLFAIEDTKAQAFNVGVKLDQVDDPRLTEEESSA